MKFRRRRSSLLPKPDWRAQTPGSRLTGSSWSRSEQGRARVDPRASRWRLMALGCAVLELLMLLVLGAAQLFPVRQVQVSGLHRLASTQVRETAGLGRPVSVFSVDSDLVSRRLAALPWVREAHVSTSLPDRVTIAISEWQPVAVYRGTGNPVASYLSDQGVVLGPAGADAGPLLLIEGPAGTAVKAGRPVIDVRLLTAMINIQRGLPALVGEQVSGMSVDCTGNLTLTSGHGWKAYFGRVLTPEEFDSLKDKLSALKALSAEVNLHSADLSYVNLMNPSAPAVGPPKVAGKPAPPPPAVPSPSPGSGIRPVGTPTPTIQVLACR